MNILESKFHTFDRYLGSKFYVFDQIFWKVNYIHFGQFFSKIVAQKMRLFLCYAEEYFICKVIKMVLVEFMIILWREVEKLYFVCFTHDKVYVIRSRGRSIL